MHRILIANRGEIAIRVARTAAQKGIETLGIYSKDDADSLHVRAVDRAIPLDEGGPPAYLNAAHIVQIALDHECDAVHPGYGFLSENAGFARMCEAHGVTFVGPSDFTLELFGNKAKARAFADELGLPIIPGTVGPTSLEEALEFYSQSGAADVLIKAVAGGGGRGIRHVACRDEIEEAFGACSGEALESFGSGEVYIEQLVSRVRHIEVQVVGDGTGAVTHLWDRDCSAQRARQKLIEVAPAPALEPPLRDAMHGYSIKLASACRYRGVGTFEFLVPLDQPGSTAAMFFIEANGRLQVEHTVTEEIFDIDLVAVQLDIAAGGTLADVGLAPGTTRSPEKVAIQSRVNMETTLNDGLVKPAGGLIEVYEPATGPGVRTDGYGYAGYRTNPRFDSLLAKVITHANHGDYAGALARASRALSEFRIVGVETNVSQLQWLLSRPELASGRMSTSFVGENIAEGIQGVRTPKRYFDTSSEAENTPSNSTVIGRPASKAPPKATGVPGEIIAPVHGSIVAVRATLGDRVSRGEEILVLEAMKMHYPVPSELSGVLEELSVDVGDVVLEGQLLGRIAGDEFQADDFEKTSVQDLDSIRPDLHEVLSRRHRAGDESRSAIFAQRRQRGQRTARENVSDLCDPDSFVEYGRLVVAARRAITDMEELIDTSPADGLICGIGHVNGHEFGTRASRSVVLAYDYTVMAGTQGHMGNYKLNRMCDLAERYAIPAVLFAEGGGGRGSDTDNLLSPNDIFFRFARLSGSVPTVAIVSGRCFAGNALLAGCCDVIIATKDSNLGIAGPALIEGGGLGKFPAEAIGPCDDQVTSGVVDVAVADEAEAVLVAKKYLSYFQGRRDDWECLDQRQLRQIVPEDRRRAYDMRVLIEHLADTATFLELRRGFGEAVITGFLRIQGIPLGVIANSPIHLGGAIDSNAADKVARFAQLCEAHGIPIVSLMDTPGNMVGPTAERTGSVRHCARLLLTGSHLTVPLFVVIVRKGYGLGMLAMAGGSLSAGMFVVGWPTAQLGAMGLEGQVKIARRRELDEVDDPSERAAAFEEMVNALHEKGKALNAATLFQIDEVIDPMETRKWIVSGIDALPESGRMRDRIAPPVDSW